MSSERLTNIFESQERPKEVFNIRMSFQRIFLYFAKRVEGLFVS